MHSVVALLLLVWPVITDTRPIDSPVTWPTGDHPVVIEPTSGGMVVAVVDATRLVHLRVLSPNGTFGPPVRLGGAPIEWVSLARSANGIIIASTDNTLVGHTQVFDPVTGTLSPTPLSIGSVGSNTPMISGHPGRLIVATSQVIMSPHQFINRLNDDGSLGASQTDVSAFGTLQGLATNDLSHYALFADYLADGGTSSTLVTVGDSTSATPLKSFTAIYSQIVATPSNVVLLNLDGSGIDLVFVNTQGQLVSTQHLPDYCRQGAVAARGDVVWLGCNVTSFSDFGVVEVSPDGGVARATVFAGDGGTVRPVSLAAGAAPNLFFTRNFDTIGRGNYRGAMVVPLAFDGLSTVGPDVMVLPRPSSQVGGAFTSRVTTDHLAFAWSDDKQLPDQFYLTAMKLSPSGQPLESPVSLEHPSSSFTSPNGLGRFIATDGNAYMFAQWNGFFLQPEKWSFAGGPLVDGQLLTTSLPGAPTITAGTSGYYLSYNTYYPVKGTWVDTNGLNAGPVTAITSTSRGLLDAVIDGPRTLQLLAEPPGLSLISVNSAGVASTLLLITTAQYATAGRLARSDSTLLVAWTEASASNPVIVHATRVAFDGTRLDTPELQYGVSLLSTLVANLTDIGVRDGVFEVVGVSGAFGASNAWVWPIDADGGSPGGRLLGPPNDVLSVNAGPQLDGGSMLVAFTRGDAVFQPYSERLYFGLLHDDAPNGSACTRDGDCLANLCLNSLCGVPLPDAGLDAGAQVPDAGSSTSDAGADAGVESPDAGLDAPDANLLIVDAGPRVPSDDAGAAMESGDAGFSIRTAPYRVGCGCSGSGDGLWATLVLLGLALGSRRRFAGER